MSLRTCGRLVVSSILAAWASAVAAQQGNLISNGQFNTSTSPWPTGQSDYSTLVFDAAYDADLCGFSGAAKVTLDSSVNNGSTFLGVCRSSVTAGASYEIQAAFRFPTTAIDGLAHVQASFYDGPSCTGNSVSTSGFYAGDAQSNTTSWQFFSHTQNAPASAASAKIYIFVKQIVADQAPLVVRLDDIVFARSFYIYSDNFEVNSICRWNY